MCAMKQMKKCESMRVRQKQGHIDGNLQFLLYHWWPKDTEQGPAVFWTLAHLPKFDLYSHFLNEV